MKENTKNVLLGVLIVGLVAMTVAYAALSTTLRISGTASVPDVTWNVHFANWALVPTDNELGSSYQNTAEATAVADLTQTASVANSTKVEGIHVSLKQPGDNVKYTFKIVNEGTIDAKLSGITAKLDSTEVTTRQAINDGVVTYNVSCAGENELVKSTGEATCELTIKYNQGITNQNQNQAGLDQTYTQEAKNLTFEASWVYIQK